MLGGGEAERKSYWQFWAIEGKQEKNLSEFWFPLRFVCVHVPLGEEVEETPAPRGWWPHQQIPADNLERLYNMMIVHLTFSHSKSIAAQSNEPELPV